MKYESVKSKIEEALRILLERDKELLEIDINERTLCHRLAIYIEEIFNGYNVDCEYNRIELDPKKMFFKKIENLYDDDEFKKMGVKDTVAKTVYPDIIVHKRKTNEENLLVMEVKKSTNKINKDFDIKKLEEYKKQLQYKHAVFLKIKVGDTFNSLKEKMDFYELIPVVEA